MSEISKAQVSKALVSKALVSKAQVSKAQSVEGKGDYQAAHHKSGTQVIDAHLALATDETLLLELFEAQLREVAGLSAITAWGFTGSDLAIETNIHPFDLSVMNTSGMVSTWGWSSPGVDGLSSDLNTHGVSSFDGLYSMPANGNLLQGIGNTNSLIEDFDLGMDEEQVSAAQYKARPSDRNQIGLEAAGSNRLDDQGKNNEGSNAGGEPDRARAITKNITHNAIFSQQPGLEGSQE